MLKGNRRTRTRVVKPQALARLCHEMTLLSLPHDVLCRVLARISLQHRDSVRRTCSLLNQALSSAAFHAARVECPEMVLTIVHGAIGPTGDLGGDLQVWTRFGTLWHQLRCATSEAHFPDTWVVEKLEDALLFRDDVVMFGHAVDVTHVGDVNKFRSLVFSFNARARAWRRLPGMTAARSQAACGVIGGRIVVAGGGVGGDQAEATASVESFDPARGEWEGTTPMPLPTRGSAFGVLDGKLFVAGGWSADGVTQALQAFDPSTKVWEHKAPLPFRLWGAASCVHEGVLYVIGGRLIDEESAKSNA